MASTIWISGDTHFGEEHVISLFERPFADVATMDAALLDAINRTVKKRDVLIHIGDFCGPFQEGCDAQVGHAVDIRNKIVCKNIQLIRGNHDPKIAKFEALFDSVKNQATFRRDNGGERVVLCHYPLRAWRGQLSGAMHLYGHTHGALEELIVGIIHQFGFHMRSIFWRRDLLSHQAVGCDDKTFDMMRWKIFLNHKATRLPINEHLEISEANRFLNTSNWELP